MKEIEIESKYYQTDDNGFPEIEISFLASRFSPLAIITYFKLLLLNKKLKIEYPDYILNMNSNTYGNFLMYNVRTIMNNDEKKKNIRIICNELLKYGIKDKSIPWILFRKYATNNTVMYTLNEYLDNKNLNLEDINIDDLIWLDEDNKNLEKKR